MVLEVAIFDVTDADGFEAAYRGVREQLSNTDGCRSARMSRGVETPKRFVLMVEWDSVEAHEKNFRETERFKAWRSAIGPYFAEAPRVEHFTDVD